MDTIWAHSFPVLVQAVSHTASEVRMSLPLKWHILSQRHGYSWPGDLSTEAHTAKSQGRHSGTVVQLCWSAWDWVNMSTFFLFAAPLKQQAAQIFELLSPMWETRMQFLAPGFRLAQPGLLLALRGWTSLWKISFSISLSPSLSLSPSFQTLSFCLSNTHTHTKQYRRQNQKIYLRFSSFASYFCSPNKELINNNLLNLEMIMGLRQILCLPLNVHFCLEKKNAVRLMCNSCKTETGLEFW